MIFFCFFSACVFTLGGFSPHVHQHFFLFFFAFTLKNNHMKTQKCLKVDRYKIIVTEGHYVQRFS